MTQKSRYRISLACRRFALHLRKYTGLTLVIYTSCKYQDKLALEAMLNLNTLIELLTPNLCYFGGYMV